MRTMSFDEVFARELYHNHRNDTQIGKALNKDPSTIASWRKRRKLPSIAPTHFNNGVHYSEVLTPTQSKQMKTFINALIWASDKAINAGVKPDVGKFMDVYAGREKKWTEERRERVAR